MDISSKDRARGAMIGLAAGDAVGTAVEFKMPGSFEPVTDMVGGGAFKLKAGQWTDDTSMSLCLATSLVEKEAFDPTNQLQKYCRWYKDGYLSSNGRCFDIGVSTQTALSYFKETNDPYPGKQFPDSGGNGSLMRLAPIPIFYMDNPYLTIRRAGECAYTTHGQRQTIDATKYFAALVWGFLNGKSKEELLGDVYEPYLNAWLDQPLHKEVMEVAMGSFRDKMPPLIKGVGYSVASLEAALWSLWRNDSFEEAILEVVNLGDDADTTGAICGQMAGALWGLQEEDGNNERGVPHKWQEKITMNTEILDLADKLYGLSRTNPN